MDLAANTVILLFWVSTLVYAALVLFVAFRWLRLKAPDSHGRPPEGISVLLPVRNEEHNIHALLNNLLDQKVNIPVEFILLDDHSEDNSIKVAEPFAKNDDRLKIVRVQGHGKKEAIEEGVSIARFEWIVQTDADCRPVNGWLNSIAQFAVPEIDMLLGPVRLKGKGIAGRFQELEWLALMAVGSVQISSGKAGMASAANLIYRREVFKEVDGFSGNRDLPTGDDEFLLRKFMDSGYRVKYIPSDEILVDSTAQESWKGVINQRRRWASKWKRQSMSLFPVLLVLYYLIFLAGILLLILSQNYLALIPLAIKVFSDLFLLSSVSGRWGRKLSFIHFLIGEILYPFYAIILGILANFGLYTWKNRTYRIR